MEPALLHTAFTQPDTSFWLAALFNAFLKGMLVLAGVAALAHMLRHRAAAVRYTIWSAGLLSLLAIPLLTVVLPRWHVDALPVALERLVSPDPVRVSALDVVSQSPQVLTVTKPATSDATGPLSESKQVYTATVDGAGEAYSGSNSVLAATIDVVRSTVRDPNFDWTWWLVAAWLAGVLTGLVRLGVAHVRAYALVHRSVEVDEPSLQYLAHDIARRLGIAEPVRLRWNRWSIMPLSVGLFHSTVLLPVEAKEWAPQHREAVLLHELAHVKRRDCLVQFLAQVTCAVYWFNPLVWVAARQIQVEREHACDDIVLAAGTKASAYAEVLLEAARSLRSAAWSAPAAMAMARRSQLEGRLLSILDSDASRRRFRRGETTLAVALVAALAMPLTAMHAAPPAEEATSASSSLPMEEMTLDQETGRTAVPPQQEDHAIGARAIGEAERGPEMVEEGLSARQAEVADSLTIEQLIRLSQFGVDADYIRALRALGYSDLSVDDLIETAKFGVDADYVRSMTSAGFTNQPLGSLIELRKFGVDAEYVRDINAAGYTGLSAEDYVELRKFGVEPGTIAALTDLGYGLLPVEDLVSLSKFGVDPEFIASMREAGYEGLSLDELVGARKFGVDSDYIREMRAAGLENATLDQIIELRKRGIDAEFVRSMQEEN